MTRGSCSLDRSHVTSSKTSWTRFILSSLSESLSDISSLSPFPESLVDSFSLFLSFSLSAPVPRRVSLRTLPALTLLFQPVLLRRVLSFLLSFSLVPCRHYVEYANKSCTNVPEVWTRSPINYSVGAVDPPSLFRVVPLSLVLCPP